MDRRTVLMFAYHFPPENAVGAMRPYRFYKYLSRLGYSCHVITAADQGAAPDPSVIHVPDPFVVTPDRGLGWQCERAVRKFLLPGVTGTQWAFLASRAARHLLRNHSASEVTAISSSPPLGVNLAAWLLAKRLGTRWIADFRDPVAHNPGAGDQNAFQRWCARKIEKAVMEAADMVIANTDAAADQLQKRYPRRESRVRLIWNGFDPEARMQAAIIPERPYRLFSHVGGLYEGRTAAPLLESIGRLVAKGKVSPAQIRIRLVGTVGRGMLPSTEFLNGAQSQGWLELMAEQIPSEEARRITATSDGLLLIQPHSAVQVPGKLFEYLQVGRPVLAFIMQNSPIERILSQSAVPYRCAYAGSTPEVMDSAVEAFFALPSRPRSASQWFEDRFNGQRQVETLHEFIQSLYLPLKS